MSLYEKVKAFRKLTRIEDYYGSSIVIVALGVLTNPTLNFIDRGLLLISILAFNCFVYAVNDIEDAEDDAHDPKKILRNPVSAGLLTKKSAYFTANILALISFIIFIYFGLWTTIIGLVALLTGFLYSYKRIRLKSVPILDIISHALFLGSFQVLTVSLAHRNPPNLSVYALTILIFLYSAFGDINNEIRDFEVDKKTKINNTAQLLNLKRTESFIHFLSIILVFAMIIFIIFTASLYSIFVIFGFALVFGLYYMVKFLRHRKRGFYDQFAQTIATCTGLILLLLN